MYFIPLAIIAISLAGILCIIIRKARLLSAKTEGDLVYPEFRTEKQESEAGQASHLSFLKILKGLPILKGGKGDGLVLFTEKFFRKMRVSLMKIENTLGSITNRLHKATQRRAHRRLEELNGSREASEKVEGEEAGPAEGEGTRQEREGPGPATASFIGLHQNDTKFDEEYWLNVLKQDSKSVYPYKKLGEIYIARKEFGEARGVLKYALKLDPNDIEARVMFEEAKGKRTLRRES